MQPRLRKILTFVSTYPAIVWLWKILGFWSRTEFIVRKIRILFPLIERFLNIPTVVAFFLWVGGALIWTDNLRNIVVQRQRRKFVPQWERLRSDFRSMTSSPAVHMVQGRPQELWVSGGDRAQSSRFDHLSALAGNLLVRTPISLSKGRNSERGRLGAALVACTLHVARETFAPPCSRRHGPTRRKISSLRPFHD